MQTRTWNVNLTATDEFPETTLEGVSHDDAVAIMRELMYGSTASARKHVEDAARASNARIVLAA